MPPQIEIDPFLSLQRVALGRGRRGRALGAGSKYPDLNDPPVARAARVADAGYTKILQRGQSCDDLIGWPCDVDIDHRIAVRLIAQVETKRRGQLFQDLGERSFPGDEMDCGAAVIPADEHVGPGVRRSAEGHAERNG